MVSPILVEVVVKDFSGCFLFSCFVLFFCRGKSVSSQQLFPWDGLAIFWLINKYWVVLWWFTSFQILALGIYMENRTKSSKCKNRTTRYNTSRSNNRIVYFSCWHWSTLIRIAINSRIPRLYICNVIHTHTRELLCQILSKILSKYIQEDVDIHIVILSEQHGKI